MGRKGSATVHIDAPPEAVYDLVTDLSRMGEWSPETVSAAWLDGATGPAAGARFKGTNRMGFMRWSTKPRVEVAEPGREFTFVTTNGSGTKAYTRWRYTFAVSGTGTEVTESWESLASLPVVGALMMNDRREKQLNEGCATTLRRIKAAAES